MMTTKKLILLTLIFIIALTAVRLVWYSPELFRHQPKAEQGQLDLRSWQIPAKGVISLNGEWTFYPMQLWDPNDSEAVPSTSSSIHVPGSWTEAFTDIDSSYRYGTYRLRIWLPENGEHNYSIRTGNIRYASAIYANGILLQKSGNPSETPEPLTPLNLPSTLDLPVGTDSIDLIIQISSHMPKSGIKTALWFGMQGAVSFKSNLSVSMQLLLCVVILLHGLYAIILFFIGPSHKTLIYFFLLVLAATLSVLVDDDRLLFHWLTVPFETGVKLVFLSYMCIAAVVPPLIKQLFSRYDRGHSLIWFYLLCAAFCLFVVLAPSQFLLNFTALLIGLLPLSLLVSLRILRKAVLHDPDMLFLVLATSAIILNVAWGALNSLALIAHPVYYPIDLIIAFLCFATFWFKQFIRKSEQSSQLAAKLQHEDRRKDQFLANTSHELRNPLHGIINIAQSMQEDKVHPPSEQNAQNLELLISIGKRMSYLLKDMMDTTRLKENRVTLHVVPLDVRAVTAGVLEMVRFMTEGRPVRFKTIFPDSLPRVMADENRLIQVLLNLLHNAVKYTDKGEIIVSASSQDHLVYIRVSDTGVGMTEEDLSRIFQPYEQGQFSLERAAGGFGLGLHISKQLVELQGGGMEVQSTPGQGSTFSFTLPKAAVGPLINPASNPYPAQNQADEQATAQPSYRVIEADEPHNTKNTNRPVVLAVDDDVLNLTVVENVLGREHYRIIKASSASEALLLLEQQPVDLVIADVMMPYVSGYELTRTIRSRFSRVELPILLLTARSSPEDVYTGLHAGANDYVTKPVDSLELRSRVRALTDMKHTMNERLRMEAAWLQAQIKPHFLFNTLNSLAALSAFNPAKMQQLMDAFSHYLRISYDFYNAERVVQLDREFELVRSYLYIEQERFGERMNILWNVAENINIMVPPLSIQPLVENAVNHGILKRASGGTITIQTEVLQEGVRIVIRDDGVGMGSDQAMRLLDDSISSGGIGLRNTNRRLKQLYGRGLTIVSKPGHGAEVSFFIPTNRE
ncbi:ATP-binding protein [Paenibacillus paeoniae]|uniref:histidine kinase n=1 Tax=Paenibacillus paeoniae TaxID=2292705 RepID=A0A371P5J6_9BACL|nr:ATP-binding protein [Paenibacillus paeoniae]REK71179.1 response regulator [Paenibacillus paeoniae]